jgi:hypothetical protein
MLTERHGLSPQCCADDTQVYGHCSPATIGDIAARATACPYDALSWMRSNRLQLNAEEIEVVASAISRRLPQLPFTLITVGSATILPSSSVCGLGIYINANLSMQTNMQTVASCSAVQCQIRGIRRSLPTTVLLTLVVSFVLSGLNHVNETSQHTCCAACSRY